MAGKALKRFGWIGIFCFSLMGCSSDAGRTPPHVPDELAVEGPVTLRAEARGAQIYMWKPLSQAGGAGGGSWVLKAPDAVFSVDGVIGTHYAGPTWEVGDGSKVKGRKIAEHASPDATAIPWLLLEAASHEGHGLLSRVTFVQRINTTGGKAPDYAGNLAGEQVRVAYTAEYVFYGEGAHRVEK